jgi:hypothetical protein
MTPTAEREPHISAYADKNAHEYFAEAFTAAHTGNEHLLSEADAKMLDDAELPMAHAAAVGEPVPDRIVDDFKGSLVEILGGPLRAPGEPPRPVDEPPVKSRQGYSEDQARDEAGRFGEGSGERLEAFAADLTDQLAGNAPWDQQFLPPVLDKEAFDARLGRCYELAGNRILDSIRGDNPDVVAVIHGTISNGESPPLAHAWTENRDGTLHEPATDRDYTPRAFEVLFHPANEVRYTPIEAAAKMLETEHYGPWEPT